MNEQHLNETQQLVLKIYNSYADKTGKVDWKGAFSAHPEWREKLTYRGADVPQKGYSALSELRKTGLLSATPESPSSTNAPAMVRPKPRSGRKFRRLSPFAHKVLKFMLEHADPAGYIEYGVLDEKLPGWRDEFPDQKVMRQTIDRLRFSGRFKAERDAHRRSNVFANLDKPAPKLADQENQENPRTEVLDEAELQSRINKEANRIANETIDRLLEQIGCCSRCGEDFRQPLRTKLAQLKFHR